MEDLHRGCFACGIDNHGGLHLRFSEDEQGGVAAVWQPSAEYQSYPDRVHGGIIATLLDCAIVHALCAKGILGVTAELSVRYLHSVTLDREVRVSASEESCRHRVHLCHAQIVQDGRIAVRASAKFMALPVGSAAA